MEIKTGIQETGNNVQTDIKMQHERLGHLRVKALQSMNNGETILVTLTGNDKYIIREACQNVKQAQLSFKMLERSTTHASNIGYSNVGGL